MSAEAPTGTSSVTSARAPKVTIGLPVFNGQAYLAETLDSLLGQDYADFELLVADNASTDDTLAIVQSYAAADNRVRLLLSECNRGAAWNYNRLVAAARGEYFKWAGYDDLLAPSWLRECVHVLDRTPQASVAFCGTAIIDARGERVLDYVDRLTLDDARPWRRVAQYTRRVNLCNAAFGLMRRDLMLQTRLIGRYVSSDVVFLAEMAALGPFVQIPERLFFRRVHTSSSRQGVTTLAEVAAWFDTASKRTPRAPQLRLLGEGVRSLMGLPLPWHERWTAAAAFAGVRSARRARIRAGRARAALVGRHVAASEMIHQVPRVRVAQE